MGYTPFKMKGFSGFKDSQSNMKAVSSEKLTEAVKSNKSIKALSDTPKQMSKVGKKTLKTTTKNIVSAGKQVLSAIPKPVVNVAKRFAGPVGAGLMAYDAIKTVPKVVKATQKSLKKQAKGQKVGFRKL